jgi:hypothetical protein
MCSTESTRFRLVTEPIDNLGSGSDEGDSSLLHFPSELCIFGQETVPA